MLFHAIIWMNLALVFYTWAVFGARRQGLHRRHLFLFGAGLLCDYVGTHLMLLYGRSTGIEPGWHILIGLASLGGMAFHFLLALAAALSRRAGAVNRLFHRVSLIIYSAWLIAFFTGSIAGIAG
jgi:uncharacterized repeat protein (TIGR03987 family)